MRTVLIITIKTIAIAFALASVGCIAIADFLEATPQAAPMPKPQLLLAASKAKKPAKTSKAKQKPIKAIAPITKMTIRELRAIASQEGIEGYCNMKKAELIAALA